MQKKHDIEIIKIFANETTISQTSKCGQNALMIYCHYAKNHDIEIIKILANETTINQITKDGRNALMMYCDKAEVKNETIVDILSNILKSNTDTKEDITCYICYDDIKDGTYMTKCKHYFHTVCISKWFSRKKNCPYCRSEC